MQERFFLARAHYSNIDLPEMIAGFLDGYTVEQLDAIEAEVRALAESFARSLTSESEASGSGAVGPDAPGSDAPTDPPAGPCDAQE